MIFVSYHTGGRYAAHCAALVETLDRWGLRHHVVQCKDAGDWCRNCSLKPSVIAAAMVRFPGDRIVFLDADARVRKKPGLFFDLDESIDFAAHRLDGVELLSGTLYFSGSTASRDLVMDWRMRCERDPQMWDQRHLDAALADSRVRVAWLPESYVRIFDRRKPRSEDIVIEHLQASREARRLERIH